LSDPPAAESDGVMSVLAPPASSNGDGHEPDPRLRAIGVVGPVERLDERDVVFAKGIKGRLGDIIKARVREPFPDALYRTFFFAKRADNSILWNLYEAAEGTVNPVQTPAPDPKHNADHIKEIAKFMGADLVGVCELHDEFVYTHRGNVADYPKGRLGEPIANTHRYAISLAKAMDQSRTKISPSLIENAETGLRYAELASISSMLAGYLRELGYDARAHHMLNEEVLHQPLAVLAGLGELGRNDSVISKEFGPAMRLATVTTDFPMAVDQPVRIGVREFCESCGKCATNCPAAAISHGPPTERRGIMKWHLNGERCYKFWNSNPQAWTSCANCLKSCPYTKPWTWWHRVSLALAKHSKLGRKALLVIDDVVYGKHPNPGGQALGHTYPMPVDQQPKQRDGSQPIVLTKKPTGWKNR
jgi:reductive dehalogenase